MKNFVKLFVVALAVTLVASIFVLGVSAAPATEAGADPNALKPGSDMVIFIKDAERNENFEVVGELEGDGTGFSPENPLKVMDHEEFDPGAERKKMSVMTSFYQATEILMEAGGGTLVICGPVYIGINEVNDNGSSTVRDLFTAKYGNKCIKFTSVYDGVDYRETAGAKITINTPAMISILGSSIWENIDIETMGTDRAITFDEYCTLIGEGVNCYPADETFEGVAQNYVSLGAGHRYSGSNGENPTLLVKSGTYNKITAGAWGTVDTSVMANANTYLTLEGTTKVLGVVSGTVQNKMPFSGNVNITINGGTYECDINGVGPTGMTNTDGQVTIKINGGNFKNAWSINSTAMGMAGNPPAYSVLDFSGWTGELLDLAYAHVVATDFSEIRLPAGVTVDQLNELRENAPVATEPPATEAEPEATVAPAESENSKATEKNDVEETKAPETDVKNGNNNEGTEPVEEGGSNVGLIIGIIVAVVVVAAVVVVVVMKKKKEKLSK